MCVVDFSTAKMWKKLQLSLTPEKKDKEKIKKILKLT